MSTVGEYGSVCRTILVRYGTECPYRAFLKCYASHPNILLIDNKVFVEKSAIAVVCIIVKFVSLWFGTVRTFDQYYYSLLADLVFRVLTICGPQNRGKPRFMCEITLT